MSIINYTKSSIETNINRVHKTERITKALLSSLSRDLLAYVYDSDDIEMVTRLIDGLTPVNKRVALMYFPAFLGWKFDEKSGTFGKKSKAKMYDKKLKATEDWLGVETNDIWAWAEDNVEMAVKPKDYANKLTQLVTKALKDEDEGLSASEVMYAILASEELDIAELMQSLKDFELKEVEAA